MDFSQFLGSYLEDAKYGFQAVNRALLALEREPGRMDLYDEIFRAFHSLKSSSMMLEFSDIADLAHAAEGFLDLLRKSAAAITPEAVAVLFETADTLEAMVRERSGNKSKARPDFGARIAELKERMTPHGKTSVASPEIQPAAPRFAGAPAIEKIQTIRVPAELLDSLFTQIGELTIIKNRIDNLAADTQTKELKGALAAMRRLIAGMQDTISVARMVQVGEILEKFPRMVRDLALARQKEIELVLEGRDTELDKGMLDALGEPLLHLVRNAVDHGIEPPDERRANNKPPRSTVRIATRRTENHILVEVEDDGGGIKIAQIKSAAIRNGMVTQEQAESLQDKDVLNLLFDLGVSTAEEVTGLSGRGMGLRIVKACARELGGTVEVATRIGQGTRFTLQLPLTTAIMPMLMVGVGNHVFGIPSDMVLETLEIRAQDIRQLHNDSVLILRNEVIPFAWLGQTLGVSGEREKGNSSAVIIHRGKKLMGLGVHAVLSQVENIVKPFDAFTRQFKGFSGGMILGDGRVALLLDIPTLFGFETLEEYTE